MGREIELLSQIIYSGSCLKTKGKKKQKEEEKHQKKNWSLES